MLGKLTYFQHRFLVDWVRTLEDRHIFRPQDRGWGRESYRTRSGLGRRQWTQVHLDMVYNYHSHQMRSQEDRRNFHSHPGWILGLEDKSWPVYIQLRRHLHNLPDRYRSWYGRAGCRGRYRLRWGRRGRLGGKDFYIPNRYRHVVMGSHCLPCKIMINN